MYKSEAERRYLAYIEENERKIRRDKEAASRHFGSVSIYHNGNRLGEFDSARVIEAEDGVKIVPEKRPAITPHELWFMEIAGAIAGITLSITIPGFITDWLGLWIAGLMGLVGVLSSLTVLILFCWLSVLANRAGVFD